MWSTVAAFLLWMVVPHHVLPIAAGADALTAGAGHAAYALVAAGQRQGCVRWAAAVLVSMLTVGAGSLAMGVFGADDLGPLLLHGFLAMGISHLMQEILQQVELRCFGLCSFGWALRDAVAEHERDASADCAICLEPLWQGACPVLRLPCAHVFHEGCGLRWLIRRMTCPVCRLHVKSAHSCERLRHPARDEAQPHAELVLARCKEAMQFAPVVCSLPGCVTEDV